MGKGHEQKLHEREEIEQERRERTWPGMCPTCRAEPGERCFTKSGGRSVRHKTRLRRLDVECVMHVDTLQQWPTLFPPGKTLGECMELGNYERRHANWWSQPNGVRVDDCTGDSWDQFVEGDSKTGLRVVGPDYVIPERRAARPTTATYAERRIRA